MFQYSVSHRNERMAADPCATQVTAVTVLDTDQPRVLAGVGPPSVTAAFITNPPEGTTCLFSRRGIHFNP